MSDEFGVCGTRLNKPVMYVIHRQLRRVSEDSPFRSACVKCEPGVLLFRRDQNTLELLADDCCSHCGQRYHYLDLDVVKERWG